MLLNKVRWLVEHGHEVVVVTTDQAGRAPFFEFPKDVRMVDLGINYSVDNTLPVHRKIAGYLRKVRLHRQRLTQLLMEERPDITVSLYPSESSFIPDIKDGSKKVLELHFNRYFRLQYGRRGMLGLIDRFRSRQDRMIAGRFDSFVVLTEEDRGYWGNLRNIEVIPNAALSMGKVRSTCKEKRVIAVGRLDYQKGFDRLLRIWAIVKSNEDLSDWQLDIYGQGEWHDMLVAMTSELGIAESVTIHKPVSDIASEYARSSILAMTSNYEGFPMVMIEAMSVGLPVVTFDYKCGPKDIIADRDNGMIVSNGDEKAFVDSLVFLMRDEDTRKRLSVNARSVVNTYSEEKVMEKWENLFNNLILS